MRLAVELYGTRVGTLEGESRTFDFTQEAEAIERFGVNSVVLSVAAPLAVRPRRDHASRRRNWFKELLPEGDQYDHMLVVGGVRRGDTLRFLARYGRDVAGALQIWDLDDPTEPRTPAARPVNDAEIRKLLEDPLGTPLGNSPSGGRTSLGGVQPKIVLARSGHGWSRVEGGFPSTHILKPQLDGALSTVIYDEEYGSRLARRIGLADFATEVATFDGLPTLVVERYDRHEGDRVHQEDFNQALGASGNQKYQDVGGVVTLKRVATTLLDHASASDLSKLARSVVLAVTTGNLDMHAKNISIVHEEDGTTALAPAYDVVPQAHRSDGRLALAVAGEYRHAAITSEHLTTEIASWGVHRADAVVSRALKEILEAAESEAPLDGAYDNLRSDILGFTRALLDGEPAGRR